LTGDDSDAAAEEKQQEFDVDGLSSMDELNELSRDIGGPEFGIGSTDDLAVVSVSSLDEAKDRLWDFVEDVAEDDVDKMCMGQLAGLMEELGGSDLEDGINLKEARDRVWDRATAVFEEP